jgi:hypothetical protein
MILKEKDIPLINFLEEFQRATSESVNFSVVYHHYVCYSGDNSGWYGNDKLDRRSISTFEELHIEDKEKLNILLMLTKKDLNTKGIVSVINACPFESEPYINVKNLLIEVICNLHNKTLLLEKT